ncbi:Os07g0151500 [Oryza sativa Japonica Group]|uniref:Os07g0151500 protein n=1 Tax=Oryza sativa subsp. japonica TaxID=39947 RepID=A0A0P0X2J7_ORYSJ|nr:Os07g0151500 [Oryza sativa Japonica Group]
MAIPRVATALLAGRRRAAADIVFAGVRVHHHQGAARLLQPGNLAAARLWPPPTAFSYGGRVGSLGLGARRGMSGSSGGGGGRSSGGGIPGGDGKRRLEEWTRSVDSQLEEILTELQQLSAAQMNAVKVSTSSFQSLKRSMERTGKVTTAVISLSVTASVYLVLFALYCVGVKMAYIVDADEFAKKFAHSVLDDEEFKAKLDQTADRLGAIAVSAPFRKAQEWFFGKDSSPQDDLDLEASDTWEDWAVSFSFFALSLIRGMPVYESELISKKKKGKLTTYALVEEQYRECIDAGFRPKIVPILKKGGCSNGTAKSRDEERRLQLEIRAKVEAARCRKQH